MARRSKTARRGRQAEERASWWDRMPEAARHAVCVALLLVLSLSFFGIIHFTGQTLVGGDTVQWRGMAEAMYAYEAEADEPALWAPNMFGGMPGYLIHYPDVVPQIDRIAGWLRGWIWPSSHFIFLLLGTYLLVFYLGRDHLAGVLAAAAYGLTTYIPIIFAAGHNTKFVALAFAPWLLLAFAHALRRPGLLAALLFAVACAVNLRADHPQITYYAVVLIGIWWVAEGVAAVRAGRAAPFAKATGWLVGGGLVGLLMVAHPYLALYEYKGFTIRGAGAAGGGEAGLDYGYAMSWSQGIGELVTLLVPGAYGGTGGLYWGPKPFTAGPHYIGGPVLVLAAAAVWGLWRRRPAVRGLAVAAGLMTLFSLGEHFALLNAFLFDHFPFFDAFRVPETWLSLVALALAVLAGLGAAFAARRAESDERDRRRSRALYLTAGGVAALVLLLWLGRAALFDFERPDEAQQIAGQLVQQIQRQRPELSLRDPQVQQLVHQNVQGEMMRRAELRREMFSDDALRTLLFVVLAAAVLVALRRRLVPPWAALAALALLVTVDLWGVDRRYFNEEQLTEARDSREAVPRYPFDDFILERVEEAGGPGRFRVLSLESGDPMANARPSFYYESVGGYHAAKLRLYQDFIDYLFRDAEAGFPNETMLDLLNTRYVVAGGRLPGYEPVYQDPQTGLAVLENPDVLPRAFFVGDVRVVERAEERLAIMTSDAFDPARTVLLDEPAPVEPVPLDSASTARVEPKTYTPRRLAWQVETDAPRLLVVSEVYYPAGWEAYVGGERVPILRANHLLRAVPVPAGRHEVTMRFEPALHHAGLWISAVSTALVYGGIVLLLGLAWRRRADDSEHEPTEA